MVNGDIREAEDRDIPALCILMSQLSGHVVTTDEVSNRLTFVRDSAVDSLYVCEEANEVVGAMAFRIRENIEIATRYGEISAMVIRDDWRRKGVGQRMMAFGEQLARDAGCIGTWLVSGAAREREAHVFYRDLGYEVTGYRFVKKFSE